MKKFRLLLSLFLVAGLGMLAWAAFPTTNTVQVLDPANLVEGKMYLLKNAGATSPERYLGTKAEPSGAYEAWTAETREDLAFQWELVANPTPSSSKPEFALKNENGLYLSSSMGAEGVRVLLTETPSYFLVEGVRVGESVGFTFKNVETNKYLSRNAVDATDAWLSDYKEDYTTCGNNASWLVFAVETETVEPEVPEVPETPVYYPVVCDKDQAHNRAERRLSGVALASAAYGTQTLNNPNPSMMYNEAIAWGEGFAAKAGEEVTTTFDFNGIWTHGFVYIDKNQNGQFEFAIGDGGVYVEDQEAVAYSCSASENDLAVTDDPLYDHTGATIAATERNNVNPPAYTMPNLPDGFYRMRHKTDWASLDPAGADDDFKYGSMLSNGGQFIDTRLHIHGDAVSVTAVSEGGTLTDEAGEALAATAPFGQELKFKVAADATHEVVSVKVRYGYNFDGEATQYGMEQWREADLTADDNGVYTLTAEMTSANVQVTVTYNELPPVEVDYAPTTRAARLEDGKIYMILNATSSAYQGTDRWGMFYNGDNSIKVNPTTPSAFTTQDVAYLWQVEVVDAAAGTYNIKNVANALYVNISGKVNNLNGVALTVKEFSASDMKGDGGSYMTEADNSVFTPLAEVTAADKLWTVSDGRTCWNGNPGTPPSFGTWSNSHGFAFYEINNEEAALAVLAANDAAYAVQRSDEYKALAQTVNAKFAEWMAKAQAENGVTDAANYSTNAQESVDENDSKAVPANLIDGNTETYFHSSWSNPGVAEVHNLEINRADVTGDFYIYSYRRGANDNNRPTKITITGSTDGETWNDITVLEGISVANPYYVSDIINGGDNTKIRFDVNETSTGTKFFTYSEFYLLSAAEGTFAKQLHEALAAFNSIQKLEDIAPAAALVAALDAPVEVKFELTETNPTDGAVLPAMPEVVTFTFSAPVSGFNEEVLATAQYGALYNIYVYTDWEGNEVEDVYPIADCEYSLEGSVVKATLKGAFSMNGTYKFVVPAGLVLGEGGQTNEEITVNFSIQVPELTEEERALIAEASELLAQRGVGFPTETSQAYTDLNAAIETLVAHPDNETNKAALEAAIDAYLVSADIQLPEAGKKYIFTYVTNQEKMAYLNYTGSDIALVACTDETDIPDTAAFLCEVNDNGTYSFTTADGKYLVYHSKYDGVNWLQGGGNTTGFEETKTAMADITIAKLMAGGSVNAAQEDLFGLVTWNSMRGIHNETGVETYGYTVAKNDFTDYDGAGDPFFNDAHTSAIQMTEFVYPATTVTAVNPDPMAGYVDALPTSITMEFSADITAIEAATVQTEGMRANRQEPLALTADNWGFRGNKVELTVPAEVLEGQYEMVVTLTVKDLYGNYVTYGRGANDMITLNYYATVPANTFAIKSVDPAEGEVTSLKVITLTMEDPASKEAWVGGFDDSKAVVLNDGEGKTVATATLALHPDNIAWNGNYDLAIVTLSEEITAPGTYTLVIPEATIFNSMYDPYSADYGVAWGARYNPAASFTFTIKDSDGIESIEAQNEVKTIYNLHGQKLGTNVKNLTPGIYVINGKKVVVK